MLSTVGDLCGVVLRTLGMIVTLTLGIALLGTILIICISAWIIFIPIRVVVTMLGHLVKQKEKEE